MTVKNFFSKKNLSSENPFRSVAIKQSITMSEYREMFERVMMLVLNDNEDYQPLIKEFSFRLTTMIIYLNLDEKSFPDSSELFSAIMCTPIYDKFVEQLEYPQQLELLRKGIDETTEYMVSGNVMLNNLLARASDVFDTLANEKAIMSLIQNIGIELLSKAEQELEDTSGDDEDGKTEKL